MSAYLFVVVLTSVVGFVIGYGWNRDCVAMIAEFRRRMLRCNSVMALSALDNDVVMFYENECVFSWNYTRIRKLRREIKARARSMTGVG